MLKNSENSNILFLGKFESSTSCTKQVASFSKIWGHVTLKSAKKSTLEAY